MPYPAYPCSGMDSSICETGANERRWSGQGPCLRRASIWAFVPYPLCLQTVLRVGSVRFRHHAVPRHLGQNAGGSYGEAPAVPLYNGAVRHRKPLDRQSIHQAEICTQGQTFHRTRHRQMSGSQNVEPVYFFHGSHSYGTHRLFTLQKSQKQAFPFAAVNCLESFKPVNSSARTGKITAPATTGPANGPRPASSTPATQRKPEARASISKLISGCGFPSWRYSSSCSSGRRASRICVILLPSDPVTTAR